MAAAIIVEKKTVTHVQCSDPEMQSGVQNLSRTVHDDGRNGNDKQSPWVRPCD